MANSHGLTAVLTHLDFDYTMQIMLFADTQFLLHRGFDVIYPYAQVVQYKNVSLDILQVKSAQSIKSPSNLYKS